MGVIGLAMKIQPISRDALTTCARLYCNALTSDITDCDNDFNAMQSKFMKCMMGKCLYTLGCNALPVRRLTYPVPEIAKLVLLLDGIQPSTT